MAQKEVALTQLQQKLGKPKPLAESIQDLIKMVFKSRGRNLLVAFFAFVATWLCLHALHRFIRKISPFHKKDRRSFYVRLFDISFVLLSAVLAMLSVLTSFYFLGDWLLLSLAIIFILGLGWASKKAIPIFWNQAKLMLNFGPVRENELVIYKDVPYQVGPINVFTELTNPRLQAGAIRLPLKDLLDLRSRPISGDEPWFPSNVGDWVLLTDGRYGKIATQTPELVQLDTMGGASRVYRTGDYLGQSPLNLSAGYLITATFGLDYAHQTIITKEVPAILEKALQDGFVEHGYAECVKSLKVEFKQAAASSLDLIILAHLTEKAGGKYYPLERAIQRICVDTCNQHNWVIPFQQVTVHMAQGA